MVRVRASQEEPSVGAFGHPWVMQQGPLLCLPFEFFVMSTLSKFVEFCIQACGATKPGREAEFSETAGAFQQGSDPLPHVCPPHCPAPT